MNISLALSHFINLLAGSTLLHSKFSFAELLPFASTTFMKQMQTTSEVFSEEPELYYAIQHHNPLREYLLTVVAESLANIRQMILQSDSTTFTQFMKKGNAYFTQHLVQEERIVG